MRLFAKCLVMAAMTVPVAAFGQRAAGAAAPAAAAAPSCDGRMAIIRVSTITTGGSMEKFMAAVEAQKNWYKSHGLSDMIFASKILERDAATKTSSYSTTQAITYHFYGKSTETMPAHDAAWDEFVKMYAETSTIKDSYLSCIPAGMVPMAGR